MVHRVFFIVIPGFCILFSANTAASADNAMQDSSDEPLTFSAGHTTIDESMNTRFYEFPRKIFRQLKNI